MSNPPTTLSPLPTRGRATKAVCPETRDGVYRRFRLRPGAAKDQVGGISVAVVGYSTAFGVQRKHRIVQDWSRIDRHGDGFLHHIAACLPASFEGC
jgi:hypothetical protein|tara:strand:+ start:3662 stop:3949 length:288 start_codon:yes stop_codon:yes gene_type:complete